MPPVTTLHVNGTAHGCNAAADRTLLSVLRDDLALTGAKYGCGEGQCGSCTVLVDGVPVRSCLTPVGTLGSQKITTVEGLEKSGRLHPLQAAYLQHECFQCGYCTSGMLMSGVALLAKNPSPTVDEIVAAMDGNLCRCGVYAQIIAAVQTAARTLKGGAR